MGLREGPGMIAKRLVQKTSDWNAMRAGFRWPNPARYNIAEQIYERWARVEPERVALIYIRPDGEPRAYIRNVFLPPTALKLMRQSKAAPVDMRSVGSGGEALGAELLDWGHTRLGTTINEFYGQTECNLVLGNSHEAFAPKAGSTGKASIGAEVAKPAQIWGPRAPNGLISILFFTG